MNKGNDNIIIKLQENGFKWTQFCQPENVSTVSDKYMLLTANAIIVSFRILM